MNYEFHTLLPIHREGSEVDVWVHTLIEWDDLHGAPTILALTSEAEEVTNHWASAKSSLMELAILSDVMQLYHADNIGDSPNQGGLSENEDSR